MTQGMFAAASGVRANQLKMNVISNNIANVNTIGFKASRANFATVFAKTITGGTAPSGLLGGTNPQQQGSGVLISEIANDFSQGGSEFTGRNTDLMINGQGFFALEKLDANTGTNSSYYLTRGGNFTLDSLGSLGTSTGSRVRGTSQLSGSSATTTTTVQIPQQFLIIKDLDVNGNVLGTHFASVGTPGGNIAAAAVAGTVSQNTATVSMLTFTIGSDGSVSTTYSNGDRISVRTDVGTIVAGSPTLTRREITHLPSEGGTFAADNDGDGLTSQATDSGICDQILGFEVFQAPAGGIAMEGMQLQLQMATVTNPNGLLYEGNNNFVISANSGTTQFGTPGSENRGNLQAGALESSNVDLAGEFTSLIIGQRGLEAASRVIRSQSEAMQAIINII